MPDILTQLRKNACLNQKKTGELLGIAPHDVYAMEHSRASADAETIIAIIKPKLEEMSQEGWLYKENFTVNEAYLKKVCAAAHRLRETQHMTQEKFAHTLGIKKSYYSELENEFSRRHPGSPSVALPVILSAARKICDVYHFETMEAFLESAPVNAANCAAQITRLKEQTPSVPHAAAVHSGSKGVQAPESQKHVSQRPEKVSFTMKDGRITHAGMEWLKRHNATRQR